MMSRLRRMVFPLAALGLLVLLSACTLSLAEDVTPPPDYVAPVQEQQPVASSTIFPLVPMDPAQGAPIFAEKCAPCHGPQGKGDGAQASRLPLPVPAIGTPELARSARPVDWFTVVSQGRIEKMMPGFSGSLNDRQRWDVVAYVFSLSAPAETVKQGEAIFVEKCQSCHGENGKGGTAAAFNDPAALVQNSDQELFQVIGQGNAKGMPLFSDQLDEAQIWAVSSYLRSLGYAAVSAPVESASATQAVQGTPASPAETALATPAVTPGEQRIAVRGKVVHASGDVLPADAQVTLVGYDGMQPALSIKTPLKADGSYAFEDVPLADGRVFMATFEFQKTVFNSDILHGTDIKPGQPADLPIMVYASTQDISALSADRMHLFFDFTKPDFVQVVELFIISNGGDRVVAPAEDGKPALQFELPQGAVNLQFQDGELGGRYVQTEKGFGDTQPIAPGSGQYQVLFAYDLPYTRKLELSIPLPLNVDAAVAMIPVDGVKLQSSQLTDMGERAVQGAQLHLYSASQLQAGQNLQISLSGKASSGAQLSPTSNTSLAIGIGALGFAFIVAGVWIYRRRAGRAVEPAEAALPQAETAADLMDQIAALDDLYQAGELSEDAYQTRRPQLKARLKALLENETRPTPTDTTAA